MPKKPKLSLNLNDINNGAGLQNTIVDTVKILEEHTMPSSVEPRSYKRISYKKIKSSPLNDYPIEELEEMENLLLKYGLLEPFSVHYDEDKDLYMLESGDRRFHALNNLFQRFENTDETASSIDIDLYQNNLHSLYVDGIYCMVENGPHDDDSVKARIIVHNETNRPFDILRTASKINELSEIYFRQNEKLPNGQKINVNEKIAAELKGRYTVRQIIRYKNFDKLIDELKNIVIEHNMSISEISTYHTLTEQEQEVLAEYISQYHIPGTKMELPSREELREIVSSALTENTKEYTPPVESAGEEKVPDTDLSVAPINGHQPDQQSEPEPIPDVDTLKANAVKKIQEVKSKKDSKINDAAQSIDKKAQQLEKAVFSYIADETEIDLDLENLVRELTSAIQTLTSIKSFLENQGN